MNNAPAVFVPTEPESNGLTWPTLLSLLAHGIVLGLLIYNYQTPVIETAGSIETTMVSPEQLAEMQGQILANRAAASAQQASGTPSSSSNSESASETPNVYSSDSSSSSQSTQPSSQKVPVFLQSDDGTDTPILMSEQQQERYTQQSEEYQRQLAQWSAEQQAITDERLKRIEQKKQQDDQAVENRLKAFHDKQLNPPKIEKPTAKQRNIEITSGSSGSAGKSFSLSDGESTISGDSATTSSKPGSSSSASGNRGASNSEIINLIKRNYQPPVAARGSTQRTTLTITVRSNGDVANVTASGPDSAVNEAARQAVLNTGNLPIDADDPKYPTFNIQFKGSN
ncbi:cell envelope integrity protein TolA [Psychrobacter sp. T6-1]|uniref:cell envelope integrity protein TolA n=1 Tax=Psychrobacter sp. T6-1 TaxID=3457447 RepID=UPI003FD467E8